MYSLSIRKLKHHHLAVFRFTTEGVPSKDIDKGRSEIIKETIMILVSAVGQFGTRLTRNCKIENVDDCLMIKVAYNPLDTLGLRESFLKNFTEVRYMDFNHEEDILKLKESAILANKNNKNNL